MFVKLLLLSLLVDQTLEKAVHNFQHKTSTEVSLSVHHRTDYSKQSEAGNMVVILR